MVEKAVIAERAKGTSWEVIGDILGGVSKSAAQKRWGTVVARWRESADVAPRKLPAYVPDDLAEFSAAYDELDGAWKQATEIVARQPLLADLNNATVALSGSPGGHTGTGILAARRFREAQDHDAVRARGAQAVEAILAQEEQARDAFRRATAGLPENGRDNPENADRAIEPNAAWAEYRRARARDSRRANAQWAYAEFHRPELTLEERVTRLENAFKDLLRDELERP
ncbi:hypothetical protein ACFY3M_50740 [Streptomyces mirabilis]|uniref:hypothetical protein n=1 Tax=Streptomyces mirabilis TaxID=68239 RepID=UPI00368D49AD